mgnify:CR=1 FL=1
MALRRLRILVGEECGIPLNEAFELIRSERVKVNGEIARTTMLVAETDVVTFDDKIISNKIQYAYVLFYKPRGIECTLNESIPDNLLSVFHHPFRLYPVGRLDKDSEGLLLMTNDGKLYHEVAHAESGKEKEYYVEVHKPIDESFIDAMRSGIEILGKKTDPCELFSDANNVSAFRIILRQGMNRQIRRMCYKLGFSVHKLVRTRIMHLHVGDLQPGTWRDITKAELLLLRP